MNLLQAVRRRAARSELPSAFDPFASLINTGARPINGQFETTTATLEEMAEKVYRRSGPVFALIAIRQAIFGEGRFAWRDKVSGNIFGDPSLARLEDPWPGAKTSTLLRRMELDVSLMGNAFVTDVLGDRLRRLRPDWMTIIWGSNDDPELYGDALDGELVGYLYAPRMPGTAGFGIGKVLMPEEVAHYAPYPDPAYQQRGMSWLTPVLREIQSDESALDHKQAFFRNGAVPKLAMKVDPSVTPENFRKLVAAMEEAHSGVWNHYKTLYVGGGADPVPLTFNLRDLDFKAIQGAGETRLAAAAGIPPVIAGFSEGLTGSSLNAGNFQQARRRLGDLTARPLWRDVCGALETIVPPPNRNAELAIDDRDIAFLREDRTDAATIASEKATTARTFIDAGFDPDAAIKAADTGDLAVLVGKHTGLYSVQLQAPAAGELPPGQAPTETKADDETAEPTPDDETAEGETAQ